jgi:hypothetical protein
MYGRNDTKFIGSAITGLKPAGALLISYYSYGDSRDEMRITWTITKGLEKTDETSAVNFKK